MDGDSGRDDIGFDDGVPQVDDGDSSKDQTDEIPEWRMAFTPRLRLLLTSLLERSGDWRSY